MVTLCHICICIMNVNYILSCLIMFSRKETTVRHCTNHASSCSVFVTNKMHNFFLFCFVIRLYLQYTLYTFRTVSVHLQERSFFHKLYVIFGIFGYVWLLCCYSNTKTVFLIATQQPDVSEYTKCDVQLIKLLLMMD